MKKIVLLVLLLGIAGIAGVVRSHTKTSGFTSWALPNTSNRPSDKVRDEIRKTFDLTPGARVEVSGINGWVKIETSDRKTADIYIERFGDSQEALNRRKIIIENPAGGLVIRGEKDGSFLSRAFGSNPTEHVTLRIPRQVSLVTSGVNGSVTSGSIDGTLHVSGINGQVEVAYATGSAEISGINGNVTVGLDRIGNEGVDISGINGNIELRLGNQVNANLDTHGMNGRVTSDLGNVTIDKNGHGSYSAQIGNGGSAISASGINGNIHLSRLGDRNDDSKAGS